MKIAVTASSGNLGQLLLPELVRLVGTKNVVGIARSPEKITLGNIETRQADYENSEDWSIALEGIDTVILISSPAGPWDRIQMHRNVIEGAKQAGVRKILYSSVIGNGKEADTLYAPVAAINRQAEQDIQESGLKWSIPRNGLYLEFDVAHIVNAANEGNIFRNNGGEGRCGYITRDEIAVATAQIAIDDQHNGKIYNLVGECHTQAELVQMVNEVHGLHVNYEAISDAECFAKLEPLRGEIVANMLTGCYQCIRNGAYDVASDFKAATGRPAKSITQQIAEINGNPTSL
ncbi:MAG: NAD(P)H-binding protein [Gammaproteobacteria bacterium]|nr:NAD(P)H-binding protein [Gammaproteobacteria bacterium]MCP4090734.1 NAD(P)H-binding protein [Gammaproteobacteria bacterium]MCP4277161.1 NAD(P)H-binding protein [Gammaproteobacteria bacterium]MCP4831705.1 NAD(P)H-binding protein [Gammaproteobacteria bacterium]MCP4928029.1 NAD(P)H-binding protein [Gammaproteobacteria bacterium]